MKAKQLISPKDLAAKYAAKIASSGISASAAKLLQYKLLTAEQTEKLGHRSVPSFTLPYFDLKGKATKFYRIRYLATTKTGMAKLTDAKEQRYDQPAKTVNEVYFPPLMKQSWEAYLKTDGAIIITEGELKAACATLHGYPTCALGGVWCFKSNKQELQVLPVFKEMHLKGKTVYICFDSDAVTNPGVAAAENVLCRELLAMEAIPMIVRLPYSAERKMGLDDYIMEHGKAALQPLLDNATVYKAAQELFKMNEEVIYIENPSLVLRHRDNYKMSCNSFKNEVYANRLYMDYNNEKPKQARTAEEWMRWQGRATANSFVYEPGQPHLIKGQYLNMWKGLPYQPRKGDIKPWITLLDYIFSGDKVARKWFEQWLAYPLQNLGTKLFTATVLWSVATGTGKTLIGHTMQRLYGENSIMIRKKDLLSGNNTFAENKQFILGDEITGEEKRSMVDELKGLITNEELRINIKFVPEYSVRSCVNYMFTSNNPDAFFIDETDRRFFVHEITGDPLPFEFYSGVYDPWYKSDDGAAALLHHLLHLDTSDFKPMAPAPMTHAKSEMIANSRSVLSNWVHAVRENPDSVLRTGKAVIAHALWTTEDLMKVFDPEGKSRVGVRGMAVELKRARLPKAAAGMGCRTANGQVRLWAVRDAAKHMAATPKDAGSAYDKERAWHDHNTKVQGRK